MAARLEQLAEQLADLRAGGQNASADLDKARASHDELKQAHAKQLRQLQDQLAQFTADAEVQKQVSPHTIIKEGVLTRGLNRS